MASGHLDNGSPGPTCPSRWTADSREKERRKGDDAVLFKDLSHLCGHARVCFLSPPQHGGLSPKHALRKEWEVAPGARVLLLTGSLHRVW